MDDLDKYIKTRKKRSPKFAKNFDKGMALRWTGKAGTFFSFAKVITKLTFALSYLAFHPLMPSVILFPLLKNISSVVSI